jgi:predicted transcriptional regulator
MGRELTDFQLDILRLAAKNRKALPERLMKKYKRYVQAWEEERDFCAQRGLKQPSPPDRFAPAFQLDLQPDITAREVVETLYADSGRRRSTQISVSQVLARLVKRGLLRRIDDGLQITETGLALVRNQSEPEPTKKEAEAERGEVNCLYVVFVDAETITHNEHTQTVIPRKERHGP